MKRTYFLLIAIFIGFILLADSFPTPTSGQSAPTIEKWRRFVVSLPNATYSGNPFELQVDATFTHTPSGTTIKLPGYYAGSDTWKIGFMPTQTGEWTYTTTSTDPELNAKTGSFMAVASGHPGMLKADPANPNKWKYTDGSYVVPIGVFASAMLDPASDAEFTAMADFLKANNLQLLNFRLSENDKAFSSVSSLQMDLALWDRLEKRMEILTERGLGIDIMLYTDDSGKPSYPAQSQAEQLLIRYMVARLAGYPVVHFNTGIDLAEYRTQSWVNWYGQQLAVLDPYNHPRSSRYGGGSGNLVMAGQTYNSVGERNSTLSGLLNAYNTADNVPAANNDNWSEDLATSNINGHTREDIRRAGWKATIAGGVGIHIRHNTINCVGGITECDRYFHINQIAAELDAEPWLKLVNPFIQTKLGTTFATMEPVSSLVTSTGGKYALADPGRTKILYFLMGVNDSRDSGDGGSITVKLSGLSGSYTAIWFDPRTGTETSAGTLAGGADHVLAPPSTDDWVLVLADSGPIVSGPAVSAKSGNWSDPTVWNTGAVPGASDSVTISAGHIVTYDVLSDAVLGEVLVSGTLKVSRTQNTRLKTNNNILVKAGGVLDMGTASDPIPRTVESEVVWSLSQAQADAYAGGLSFVPADKGLWVEGGGRWDTHGAAIRRTWSKLAQNVLAGSNQLTVEHDVSDWYVGGSVVVTSTRIPVEFFFLSGFGETAKNLPLENEVRTIQSIQVLANGQSVITLTSPVSFAHEGTAPFRGEVGLLKRNVRLTTEIAGNTPSAFISDTRTRKFAHTFRFPNSLGNTEYTEFTFMGHYGVEARNPVNLHNMKASAQGMVIRGNSCSYSGFSCVAIRKAYGVLLEDNVAYKSMGSDFGELNSRGDLYPESNMDIAYVHNLTIDARPKHGADISNATVFGPRNVGGFVLSVGHRYNALLGNVAVPGGGGLGNNAGYRFPEVSGNGSAVPPGTIPFTFVSNEAHSGPEFGIWEWQWSRLSRDMVDTLLWRNSVGVYWSDHGEPLKFYNAKALENAKTGFYVRSHNSFLQDSLVVGTQADLSSRDDGYIVVDFIAGQDPTLVSHLIRNTFQKLTSGISQLAKSCAATFSLKDRPHMDGGCSANYMQLMGNTFSNVQTPMDFDFLPNPNSWSRVFDANVLSLPNDFVLLRNDQQDPAAQGVIPAQLITSQSVYSPVLDAVVTPMSSLPPLTQFQGLLDVQSTPTIDFDFTTQKDYPPQISLSHSLNGKSVTLTANATDDKQVTKIEFLVDWEVVHTVNNPTGPVQTTVDLSSHPRKYAYLYARAFDGTTHKSSSIDPFYENRGYSKVVELGPEVLVAGGTPTGTTPTITSLSRLHLFLDKLSKVTLTGTNFDPLATVSFRMKNSTGTVKIDIPITPINSTTIEIDFIIQSVTSSTLPPDIYEIELESSGGIATKANFVVTKLGDLWSQNATASDPEPRDGKIDIHDVTRMLSTFGKAAGATGFNQEADINPGPANVSSGKVDIFDANKLMTNWTGSTSSPASGQIIVDPSTPRWLVYNRDTDGNGKLDPFFLSGAGGPEGFLYGDFVSGWTQDSIIDYLISNGMNSIYLMAVRSHGGDGGSTQNPWINHDPSNGLDQSVLDQWEKWFTKMDKNGIVIFFVFYDDGVGYVGGDQFIRDIVNEFEHHKNLIWAIAEEYSEGLSQSQVRQIADIIRVEDDNNHPIANHQLSGKVFDFPDDLDQFAIQDSGNSPSDLHADALIAWNNAANRYNVNFAEHHFLDIGLVSNSDYRRGIWALAMGGAYMMQLGDWEPRNNRKPPTVEMANASRNLVTFFESSNFNEMSPNDALAFGGTEYVLAKPGDSYIVYASALSGNIGLRSMTAGTYTFTWLDIPSGNTVTQQNVSVGGGDQTWTKPSGIGSELALYIQNIQKSTSSVDPVKVATGAYPDVDVDQSGNVHLVYARSGKLYYRKYDISSKSWGAEQDTGLSTGRVERSDPEIVIDSIGRPHVLVGSSYAFWNGSSWTPISPGVDRDTAMAIDSADNIYIVRRGGSSGGFVGLKFRPAGSGSFVSLPDADVANGLPLGRNDHVYGHVFVNPVDDSIHVVYRHGAPSNFAYRGSTDSGQNWFGGGVSGDDLEAPSGVAANNGTMYVVGGNGTVYRRTGTPSSWQDLGRAVTSGSRDLPALFTDSNGNLYVTSFGGKYNVYSSGNWVGEQSLPSLGGQPLGFAESVAGTGGFAYVVWEEGSVNNDLQNSGAATSIIFATISADGTIGG